MRYNEEKTLYFADQEKGLHVAPDEATRKTDLHILVTRALNNGHIKQVARDDSGVYYRTTPAGVRRLLNLQISWREKNGKNCDAHRARLAAMTE
ncbi:hypothetical protein CSG01_048 [Cronobacter phage SG01]|uniref:Uncharacterized protein n=1 Tax=Cronobacter phage CS01 TaxID=2496544 RepID=A0A3B8DJE0_9CAUD|nr:hypothetical protein HOU43_gp38 [Cronobacter phage CS01]AYJ73326.1 hypothetical protein CS01_038 [Cronobacter phage CS01]WDS30472.1 hypothetical protein CSG01_048 [Cronobacter phage SG01]